MNETVSAHFTRAPVGSEVLRSTWGVCSRSFCIQSRLVRGVMRQNGTLAPT